MQIPDPHAAARRYQINMKKTALREKLWPGCEPELWQHKVHKGFVSVPRIATLVCSLFRRLKLKTYPGDVYHVLWSHVFEQGVVNIASEEDFAYEAGFDAPRHIRSWRERIKVLEDLGFIKTAPRGNQQYGYVLLINPELAVARLDWSQYDEHHMDIWRKAFEHRFVEIGAVSALPPEPPAAPPAPAPEPQS